MPAISARGGRRRRMVNEINVVPYIDVMLVLLVIFMVTAPMIQTGTVDVPSAGAAGDAAPDTFAQVTIDARGGLKLRLQDPRGAAGSNEERTLAGRAELADAVRALVGDRPALPVLIAADKTVRYESVMDVMAELRRQGVQRVALSVRNP